MKITELRGIKQDPIYQKVKDIFDPDKSQLSLYSIQGRRRALSKLKGIMYDLGFDYISQGIYGATFVHPNYPWVFKIFTHDQHYQWYLNYAINNQSNPYVPKIRGKYIAIDPKTYLVRIEKLQEVDQNTYEAFDDLIWALRFEINNPQAQQIISDRHPSLRKIIEDLLVYTKSSGARFDIHEGNVMLRGSQLVITDPIA